MAMKKIYRFIYLGGIILLMQIPAVLASAKSVFDPLVKIAPTGKKLIIGRSAFDQN